MPEDLVSLTKFRSISTDGRWGRDRAVFCEHAPPIAKRTGSTDKAVAVSRERYATAREVIEDKVLKWSGMERSDVPTGVSYPSIKTDEEMERAVPEDPTKVVMPETLKAVQSPHRPTAASSPRPKNSLRSI